MNTLYFSLLHIDKRRKRRDEILEASLTLGSVRVLRNYTVGKTRKKTPKQTVIQIEFVCMTSSFFGVGVGVVGVFTSKEKVIIFPFTGNE